MKSKVKIEGNKFATVIMYAAVVILCIVALYPMYYVLILSISDPTQVATGNIFLLPIGITLETYGLIVGDIQMWIAYNNTIIYVLLTTVLMIITCVLGAYPLSFKRLIGRKFVVFFLLIPMYFSGGLIPTFLLMTRIGLYDNIWAVIIPSCFGIWNIILTRTYFASIPETIREAAKIDGANHFQILMRIYVQISKPILAVIAIYTIVSVWNSWFNALVYLPSEDYQPLQLYLRRVLVEFSVDPTAILTMDEAEAVAEKSLLGDQMRYAMIIFTTLPIIFVYPFFKKHFVKGVMIGSLKG